MTKNKIAPRLHDTRAIAIRRTPNIMNDADVYINNAVISTSKKRNEKIWIIKTTAISTQRYVYRQLFRI